MKNVKVKHIKNIKQDKNKFKVLLEVEAQDNDFIEWLEELINKNI